MKLKKSSGCVFDLRMSEGSGSTAYDSSRYGNDGALNGCKWVERGLEFNGTSDYVDCGANLTDVLSANSDFTVSAMFKAAAPTGGVIIASSKAADDRTCILIYDGSMRVGTYTGVHNTKSTAFTDTANWHHIVFVLNAGIVTGYLDANLMVGGDTTITSATVGTIIGVRTDGSSLPFTGSIDQVRIHNRALNASEIKAYYDATKHKYL